jgi:DnaJ-class molecular chaperone
MSVLAGNLLMNAASWRVVRGQTYCLHCRGTGRETCASCQGSGILEPEKVRMNQLRHAAGKLQVLLGVSDARMHDSTWMKSNRCKRCRGTGALPCKHCNGTGVLGPGAPSN